MRVRDWKGNLIEAPPDLRVRIAEAFDGYLVLSSDSKDHYQVRYGPQVTHWDNPFEAASEMRACMRHGFECGFLESPSLNMETEKTYPFVVLRQGEGDGQGVLGEFETVKEAIDFGNAEVGVEWCVLDRKSRRFWEAWSREGGWFISDERAKNIMSYYGDEPKPETPIREKTLLEFISEEAGGWKDGKFVFPFHLPLDAPWLLCPCESGCGQDLVAAWETAILAIDTMLELGVGTLVLESARHQVLKRTIENCRVLYHG